MSRAIAAVTTLLALCWASPPSAREAGPPTTQAPRSARPTETAAEWFDTVAKVIRQRWPELPAAQLHNDASPDVCLQRRRWLGRDFQTMAFKNASPVCAEGHVDSEVDQTWPHVGIIVIEFPTCRSLATARAAVAKSKRDFFRIPVATKFRAFARGHALIFVLSESMLRDDVHETLASFDSFATDRKTCRRR